MTQFVDNTQLKGGKRMTQRLTDAQLATIRQRTEDTTFVSAHTKGDPWKGYEVRNDNNGLTIAETSTLSDAEFIANARQDIPLLLAEIERLNEELRMKYASGYAQAKHDCAIVLAHDNRSNDELVTEWLETTRRIDTKIYGGATE